MAEIALKREFFGKQGYVKVKFYRIVDRGTGEELIKIKGKRGGYRFGRETFPDLYAAQRFVADRIAQIDER